MVDLITELVGERPAAMSLVNATVEAGEKLYATTAPEGREVIRVQLQDLQQSFEAFFDKITQSHREVQARLGRYIKFFLEKIKKRQKSKKSSQEKCIQC
jgi:hypothetical protein